MSRNVRRGMNGENVRTKNAARETRNGRGEERAGTREDTTTMITMILSTMIDDITGPRGIVAGGHGTEKRAEDIRKMKQWYL
jgi:hypothetical protein